MGPIYGKQWRSWKGYDGECIDQIKNAIHNIKHDPFSRRIIVSSWNVGDLKKMSIYPCHCMFQFYVIDNTLSCHLYQRSGDVFLGVPFNISSYSALTMMIAKVCHLKPGEFIHTLGDAHIYLNHVNQAKLQLKRKPLKLPYLHIKYKPSIFDYNYRDFELHNYKYHPHIKGDISV